MCALNKMRTAVPKFSKKISLLHAIMEILYAEVKYKCSKKAAHNTTLENVGWYQTHKDPFDNCNTYLEEAVNIATTTKNMVRFIYTQTRPNNSGLWSTLQSIMRTCRKSRNMSRWHSYREVLPVPSPESIVEGWEIDIFHSCWNSADELVAAEFWWILTIRRPLQPSVYIYPYGSYAGIPTHT